VKKTKKERIFSALSLASIVLLFVLLLSLLVFAMYKIGALPLPDAVIAFFGLDKGEYDKDLPGDDGQIYESLLSDLENEKLEVIEYDVSALDAKKILTESSAVSVYTAKITVTLSSDGESKVMNLDIWKDGEKYRIETKEGTTPVQTLVCDGERVLIRDHVTFQTVQEQVYESSDIFSFESEAMIPSLANVFENDSLSDLSVSLLRSDKETVYFIEYKVTELGYIEKLYVSLDLGLIIRAESLSAKEMFYKLDTVSLKKGITDTEMDADELFSTK